MCNFFAGLAITAHIFTQNNYNDVHPYLFCEENGFHVGAMVNSETSLSLFSSYEFEIVDSLSAELGLASGYDRMLQFNGLPFIPMARLNWTIAEKGEFFALPIVEYDAQNQQQWGIALGFALHLSRTQFGNKTRR